MHDPLLLPPMPSSLTSTASLEHSTSDYVQASRQNGGDPILSDVATSTATVATSNGEMNVRTSAVDGPPKCSCKFTLVVLCFCLIKFVFSRIVIFYLMLPILIN